MAISSYKALIRLQPDDVSYRLAFANMLSNAAHDGRKAPDKRVKAGYENARS